MGEVIQTLWDSGALGAIFTGLVTILGQLSALNTQKYTAVLEALQKQQTADITAHDAAFTRTKDDGGTWTRRAMMFAAFAMLGIAPFVFAFFKDIPVAVETGGDCRADRRLAVGIDSRKGKFCSGVCEWILPCRCLERIDGKPRFGIRRRRAYKKSF